MAKARFSPGPWEVHGGPGEPLFYVYGANRICEIPRPSGYYQSPAEQEANARLIAAAPALLAALEGVVRYLEHPDVQEMPFALRSGPVAKKVRKFIAEVKGG